MGHGQAVLVAIKTVGARQRVGQHRWWPGPFDLVHAKRHPDLDGQHQFVERCGGRSGCRIEFGLGRDLHAGGVHFAQLQASLQQRGQLPAQVDAGDFNIQAGAAPAQPADAPAAAQRA